MSALRQAAAALRAEIKNSLPENAFLRIDRTGNALYVTSADCASLTENGWLCLPRGPVTLLSPGMIHLQSLRPLAEAHPLTAAFAARPTDPAVLPLLTALLRAMEMPPPPSALRKLDKQLRQAMAVALRENRGGGLELCHTIYTKEVFP